MFDFDTLTDRSGTYSMKWDVAENELPMWVADMDFPTVPAVKEALMRRVERNMYGYTLVPDEWRQAIVGWWKKRHHFEMDPQALVFCTGVVPAISSTVRKLTTVGENVLLQTPVYNIFFNSIVNNGRHVLESPLRYDGKSYSIDFEDLECKLADEQTTLMLLCNPHNPVGKIWDKETLARIGELCEKHHVTVLSDEIHCDLTDPGYEYAPFASVSETCARISVTCVAPTKTFNLAGLQTAAVYVPNPVLRHKVERGLNTDEVAEPNVFAIDAAIAAFTHGGPWLDELRAYLLENKRTVSGFLEEYLPMLSLLPSQATYLLWIDCGKLTNDTGVLADFIREKTGLYLSEGAQYGGDGNRFLRMNIAYPRKRLEDGLERLERGVKLFAQK